MGAKINCSICGKLTDAGLENCPHCGSPVTVGRPPAPPTPIISSGRGDNCPSCGARVQDGDIVCVRCGVSLLTGHKVVTESGAGPVVSPRRPPYVLAGLLIFVVLIVAAGVAYVVMRDPVKKARQLSRSGDLLGAVNLLQKHTANFPEDADAYAMLGRLHMQTQQFPDAASSFEKAASLAPSDEELSFLAVVAAGKIQGDGGLQRQIATLERLVKEHPDNARAVKMLALAQGATGATASSAEHLGRLAAIADSPEEVAKYQGIVDALSGDYAAAHSALAGANASDPSVRAAQGYLASLEGDTFGAADALSAVVSGRQDADTEAKTRLALLYMAQGQFDLALPLLNPSDGGRPSESARFFLALCLQTAGAGDEALLEFDWLVNAGGSFAEDAAIQMAMIYLSRKQIDQAAESTRKARKFGSSARLAAIEGNIAAAQNADADAQELFRKAIQADAEYPAAHLENGLMYVRRGALSEGVRELERYLELSDPAIPGGRITEVELLVKQLKQAVERGDTAVTAERDPVEDGAPIVEPVPAAPAS